MENGSIGRLKTNSKKIKINIIDTDNGIRINRHMFNFRIFIDSCLIFFAIYFTYTIQDKYFYLIPILFMWGILLGVSWNDFQSINYIFIDIIEKKIKIVSRNLLKRFFINYLAKDKNIYSFSKISDFVIKRNFESKADIDIYNVVLKTSFDKYLPLLTFSKEENARIFLEFLKEIIK